MPGEPTTNSACVVKYASVQFYLLLICNSEGFPETWIVDVAFFVPK